MAKKGLSELDLIMNLTMERKFIKDLTMKIYLYITMMGNGG
jgi:hypothetical protein